MGDQRLYKIPTKIGTYFKHRHVILFYAEMKMFIFSNQYHFDNLTKPRPEHVLFNTSK